MNFFNQRTNPLKVEVYKGSIGTKNECLLGTDALIAIELLEHLTEDALEKMPNVIFDYMKPKLAIFTTPNKDANVLFPNLDGFRHWDHKFEWTRKEFEMWAKDICKRYPRYSVQFYQIGKGPVDKEHLSFGGVSQCAVFLDTHLVNALNAYKIIESNYIATNTIKSDFSQTGRTAWSKSCEEAIFDSTMDADQEKTSKAKNKGEISNLEAGSKIDSSFSGCLSDKEYTLIYEVQYPYTPDNRSQRQKVVDECKYQLTRMSQVEKYIKTDGSVSLIPLVDLFDFIFPLTNSLDQLRQLLLQEEYKIIDKDLIEIYLDEDEDTKEDSSDNFSELSAETKENDICDEENWD